MPIRIRPNSHEFGYSRYFRVIVTFSGWLLGVDRHRLS
jgi:hypothetical protein